MNVTQEEKQAEKQALPWQKLKVKYQPLASKAAELTRWT